MSAGDVLQAWLLIFTGACALVAVLGLIEVLLCWYQRRTAYRGLPSPDTPDLRVQRALAAYHDNARAYSGLR